MAGASASNNVVGLVMFGLLLVMVAPSEARRMLHADEKNNPSGTPRYLAAGDQCPSSCSSLFGRLETTATGERVQDVLVSQRGEPKSGTSFMFQWGQDSLMEFCFFLDKLYGKRACRTRWIGRKAFVLLFDPHDELVSSSRPCSCEDVDR